MTPDPSSPATKSPGEITSPQYDDVLVEMSCAEVGRGEEMKESADDLKFAQYLWPMDEDYLHRTPSYENEIKSNIST